MEERTENINYDAYCSKCGCSINAPHHWENHKDYFKISTALTGEICKDCGSPNLQPQGGCYVCLECGFESCSG